MRIAARTAGLKQWQESAWPSGWASGCGWPATVDAPAPGHLSAFHDFLDDLGIARDDQVVRRIAHEGVAVAGVVLTRASLVPEIRVTAEGVYWHPAAVTDEDALVTRRIEPLTPALDEISRAFADQWAHAASAAQLFPCA